jgi:hypothetical protein
VTTNRMAIDLAALRHSPIKGVLCGAVIAASFALGGCESANTLLGSTSSQPDTGVAAPQAVAQKSASSVAKVSLAPIIGAPDGVAQQIQQEFSTEAQKQRISVVKSTEERADYTLRGYLVAAKDRAGTKVSYIFDVTDPSGRRMHRITGEETADGNNAASKDPWSLVSVPTAQAIAQKSVASLAGWLPSQSGAQSQSAVASAASASPQGVGAQAAAVSSIQTAAVGGAAQAAQPPAQPAASAAAPKQQQVAAVSGGADVLAAVPSVAGAPGDGATALAAALQRELSRNGVTAASGAAQANAYRVEGKVTMGGARDGKQPIQIEWNVKDPRGKSLGTVSQKNEIPEGSLNGSWGRTADDAAGAATQGILKLLPPAKAVN